MHTIKTNQNHNIFVHEKLFQKLCKQTRFQVHFIKSNTTKDDTIISLPMNTLSTLIMLFSYVMNKLANLSTKYLHDISNCYVEYFNSSTCIATNYMSELETKKSYYLEDINHFVKIMYQESKNPFMKNSERLPRDLHDLVLIMGTDKSFCDTFLKFVTIHKRLQDIEELIKKILITFNKFYCVINFYENRDLHFDTFLDEVIHTDDNENYYFNTEYDCKFLKQEIKEQDIKEQEIKEQEIKEQEIKEQEIKEQEDEILCRNPYDHDDMLLDNNNNYEYINLDYETMNYVSLLH